MTELLAEFGCGAAQGRIMDAAELREQADMVAEQQAEVLKEKLAAERPAPEETLSFYVAECLEFTFAGEFHDHLTMDDIALCPQWTLVDFYVDKGMTAPHISTSRKIRCWWIGSVQRPEL